MSKDLGPESRREREQDMRRAAARAARKAAKTEQQDLVDGLRAELDEDNPQ